jgi:hypothetical protein
MILQDHSLSIQFCSHLDKISLTLELCNDLHTSVSGVGACQSPQTIY